MDIRAQVQRNQVADEVSALIAVVRPILVGLLFGLKGEAVTDLGGYENVKLRSLARARRRKDGDLGICFEYAVHDALRRRDPMVCERVEAALSICAIPGEQLNSILFAIEKTGSEQLIDTARELITAESRIMSGTRGHPAKLQKHLNGIAQAFRRPKAREALPYSISGVWKADLFVGNTDSDRWAATTVKSNPAHLEGARGLRVGIVPAQEGQSDAPFKDDDRNLVVCPLLYDGDFYEIFLEGWQTVQFFLAADAKLPKPAALPGGPKRQVARILAERRDFPVLDVVDALAPLAQPELLDTEEQQAEVAFTRDVPAEMQLVLTPEPRGMQS